MTPEEKKIVREINESFKAICRHADRIKELRLEISEIKQTAARITENYNQKVSERQKQPTPQIIAQIESGLAEHISKLNTEDDCA